MHFDYNQFKETCFHQIFEDTVNQFPCSTALYWSTQQDEINALSYQALNQRANQLANYLKATHSNSTQLQTPIIAVCMQQGPNYIICLLAIWKAGFIYQPLDLDEDSTSLQRKLKQSHCTGILLDDRGCQRIPSNLDNLVQTNVEDVKFQTKLVEYSQENLPNARKITDDAYLMASSGTTGIPKLIMNSFEGLPGRISGLLSHIELEPNSSILGFSNYIFDASLLDICLAFSTATALFIVPDYARKDVMGELHRLLALAKDKHIHITYSALIPDVINRIDPDQFLFKYLITMGAKANWANLKKLIERGTRVFDGYGPTETTIAATMRELGIHPVMGIVAVCQSTGEIEGVLPEVIFGLVNKESQGYSLVKNTADGEGEIILGGKGVGYYWHDDTLNQKHFIEIPKLGPGRFYLTGDMAQYKHGVVQISGRNNREIKVHGRKINLDSLEERLQTLLEVQQAAVTQVNTSIVSFVVLSTEIINPWHVLGRIQKQQNTLFKGLSSYLFTVNKIPKTHNKQTYDYRALTDLNQKDLERTLIAAETIEPYQSKLESDVGAFYVSICIDTTVISLCDSDFQISRRQSLASFGANSLHLSELYHRLWNQQVTRKEGRPYPSLYFKKRLMEADTIAELAAIIDEQNHEPLTLIQEGEYPFLYLLDTTLEQTDKFECGIYKLTPFSLVHRNSEEQLVEEIVETIIQHQAVGPYHTVLSSHHQRLEENIHKKFDQRRPEEILFITITDPLTELNSQKLEKTINHIKNHQLEAQLLHVRNKQLTDVLSPLVRPTDYLITTFHSQPTTIKASDYLDQFISHKSDAKILFLIAGIELEAIALIKMLLNDNDCLIYMNVANETSNECVLKHLNQIGFTLKDQALLKQKKITLLIDNYDMMDRYDYPNLWNSNHLSGWIKINLIVLCNHKPLVTALSSDWEETPYFIATLSYESTQTQLARPPSATAITPLTLKLIAKYPIDALSSKRFDERFSQILKKGHYSPLEYSVEQFINYSILFYESFPTNFALDFSGSYWEERYDQNTLAKYQAQLDSKYFKILRYFIVSEDSQLGELDQWFKDFLKTTRFEKRQNKAITTIGRQWNFLDFFEFKTISENKKLPPIFLFCPLSNELPLSYYDIASSLAETHSIIVILPLERQPDWQYQHQHSLILQSGLIVDQLLQNHSNLAFTLVGWSFGGILAFAVAHGLEALGRQVKQVITIDSPAITTITQMPLLDRSIAIILTMSTELHNTPGTENLAALLIEWKHEYYDPKTLFLMACKYLEAHASTTDQRITALIQKLNACYINLMAEYELAEYLKETHKEPLKAPHHSLIANISSPEIGNGIENTCAWTTLCDNHDYKIFPGNHFNLFTSAFFHYLTTLICSEHEINQIMHSTDSRILTYLDKASQILDAKTLIAFLPIGGQLHHENSETTELKTNSLNTCIDFLTSESNAIGITGPAGSGKSSLIAMLSVYLAENAIAYLQKNKTTISLAANKIPILFQAITNQNTIPLQFPIILDQGYKSSQSINEHLLRFGFSKFDIIHITSSIQCVLLLDDLETVSYSMEKLLSDINFKYPLKVLMCARTPTYNKRSPQIIELYSQYQKIVIKQQTKSLFFTLPNTSLSIQQISLNLLDENTVTDYILYINNTTSLPFKSYQGLIKQYPILKEVVLTPLSLYLFIAVFKFNRTHSSTENQKTLTQTGLYRRYLDAYYSEHYEILSKSHGIPKKNNLKKILAEYLYQLASTLNQRSKNKIDDRTYLHQDPLTNTLRGLCPIHVQNDKIRFVHDSFQDFLIAERIFAALLQQDTSLFEQCKSNDSVLILDFLVDFLINYLSQYTTPPNKDVLYDALGDAVITSRKGAETACQLYESAYGKEYVSQVHALLLHEAGQSKVARRIYLQLSQQIATEDSLAIYNLYCNLANTCLQEKDFENTKKFLDLAIQLHDQYQINDTAIGYLYNVYAALYRCRVPQNPYFNIDESKNYFERGIAEEHRYPHRVMTKRYIGWAHSGMAQILATYDWDLKLSRYHRDQFYAAITEQFGKEHLWSPTYLACLHELDEMITNLELGPCYYTINGELTLKQSKKMTEGCQKFIFSFHKGSYSLYNYSEQKQEIISAMIKSSKHLACLSSLQDKHYFHFKDPMWVSQKEDIEILHAIMIEQSAIIESMASNQLCQF